MDNASAKFCPKCGKKMMAGDAFCGSCGAKLDIPGITAAPQSAIPAASVNTEQANTPAAPADTPVPAPQANMTQVSSNTGDVPGKSAATASLVLGIVAVVCWFFGYSSLISVVCGGIGLCCAASSKKEGYEGGARTAGFILSLIGLIGGALIFVACVACVGSLAGLGRYY